MLMDQVQQFDDQLKQTRLVTLPSCTVGWGPCSQPVASVPHLKVGVHEVGIFVPAFSWKRNHEGPRDLSQR